MEINRIEAVAVNDGSRETKKATSEENEELSIFEDSETLEEGVTAKTMAEIAAEAQKGGATKTIEEIGTEGQENMSENTLKKIQKAIEKALSYKKESVNISKNSISKIWNKLTNFFKGLFK